MSRLQRLIASFGLTVAMATVAGIIIIAIVLLMQFLINISRNGG